MLSILRRFAAPVALAAIALLAAPAATFECRLFAAEEGMPCCKRTQPAPATLDGECCAITPSTPGPGQGPVTPAAATTQVQAPASTAITFVTPAASVPRPQSASIATVSPPLDRLSLSLSAIRR